MRRGKGGRNGLLPSSLRIISSCLKTVSSNAGSVASTVRSAGASVAASIAPQAEDEKDQVLWAGFDKLELHPSSFKHVLLVGYSNGFQVLDVEDAANVCELVSKRDGPVTFLQMQPTPVSSEGSEGFRASHPMLLVVAGDETNGHGAVQGGRLSALIRHTNSEPQAGNCISTPTVVRFYSLRSHTYVHVLRFRSAVYLVRCSPRIVAVALAAQIYCFDAVTLENKLSVLTYPLQGAPGVNIGYGPMAVGPRWLAYATNTPLLSNTGRLSPQNLTPSPGVSPSTSPSSGSLVARYAMESSKQLATGIINLGDMGYKTLSKYCQELLPDGSNSPLSSSPGRRSGKIPSSVHLLEADNAGMVVIKDFTSKAIISQFRAHTSPISALCFDPSGTLLVTASVHGHNINVFRIMPTCIANGSGTTRYDYTASHVHLYKLYRGMTSAVIQDISFSHFSQWISIVSSRGTCHIFTLSPFGGDASLQPQNSHSDGPPLAPCQSRPWWSKPSFLMDQQLHQVPSTVTNSVVSTIKNSTSGWLNTISNVAASASGKLSVPSGSVTAVFHNSIYHGSLPVPSKANALEHLLVYSPSGHVIQHELLPSSGSESSGSSPRVGPGPNSQLQDDEMHVTAEPIQWWDVWRRTNWPERDENIANIVLHNQRNCMMAMDASDCEDSEHSDSTPSNDGISGKEIMRVRERSSWYLSNAEVQINSWRIPIWQKSKICFYVMDHPAAESGETDSVSGGEIEIEKLPLHEVEIRRRELLPVFTGFYTACTLLGLGEISSMEAPTSPLDGTILKLPGKLDSLLRHGCTLPKGVADEIPLIKLDLEKIIGISSNLQEDDHAMMVRCWRKEVRELSYDMEDFLDQYEHAAAMNCARSIRGREITRWRKTKRTLPWIREKLRQRLWMANKIREFSARAQEALERHRLYNLDAIAGSASFSCTDDAYPTSWNGTPCGEDKAYVGIDAAMKDLEELLMMTHDQRHQKLQVVSIVGFGGIGKTTLAMELYRKLGQQFECRAFVRTSQKPDMRRIFISMLSEVRPHQPPDNWTVHGLISTIRTHLQDKRYLIIVEDLWTTSTWDIVKHALPESNCCSRILTTTEIEDLALQSCDHDPKYVYKMQPLGEDNSRKLFLSSVFGPQDECPPELRENFHDIVRKCGGLPLAIVTVASILSSQPGKQDRWDYVNKAIGYSLLTNPTWEGMKQIFDLSYNNLPQHLKACILYTGLYEEDIVIWKDDLVNQWLAEGFIQATEGQDKKEIARSFFDRLIDGKLILPVDINRNGEVLSCTIHHMVLNLVIRCKSIEENFVTAIHHSQATTTLADKVRRLSLQFGNAEDAITLPNMRLSHVRTLAFWGVFKCLPSVVQFHLLQVLILHFWGDKDSISFDITTISELFRLRYLKVTSNVTLELRAQMRGLKSLETLKIDARVSSVPSDIVHLPGLLHLSLPAETNLPNGIGHMTSLRALGCFDISSNWIENVQSLSMLTNLEDLQLTSSAVQTENLNSKMQSVLNSILGRLSKLKSVTLASRDPSNAKSIGATGMTISGGFSNLSSAPALLQSLEVSPQICIFLCTPKWIGQLHELCVLKFGVRRIDSDGVDVLGGLPALSVLTLYVQTKPAARIVIGKTGFPVIKYFRFKCCDALLEFKEGAMPNLRTLKLAFNANSNADQQSTIPVGIEYLSELKEVSAKIGGVGPEESHRRAAELEFRDAIRVHARFQRVNVQCVEQIIECKDDQSSVTTMEYLDDKSSVTTVEYDQSSVTTVEPDRSSVTTMEYLDDKSSVTTVEYPPAPAGTSLLRRTRGLRCGQAHVSVGASPSGVPLAAYRNRRDSILRDDSSLAALPPRVPVEQVWPEEDRQDTVLKMGTSYTYGFQSSSLLRSLMEPTAPAAAKTALPGFQQYDQYGQQAALAAARFAPGAIGEPLQFTNNAPFWNSSAAGFGVPPAAAAPDHASVCSVKPSPAPRAETLALKTALEGVGESSSITTKKKANGEPAFKKPRLQTPSPLPTFKVRKEKLGDRITALQQLVSPFGKTDTESVLHETIEYIKFLHDQVGVSARVEYHDSSAF